MSGFRDLGAKPKETPKTKKWNIISSTNKKQSSEKQTKESVTKEEYASSIRKEINRLEKVSIQYEDDYQHQRKLYLFNLFEKQYLLNTKVCYYNSQQELMACLQKENETISSFIQMYQVRMENNLAQLKSINEGAKTMEEYFLKLKDEVKL